MGQALYRKYRSKSLDEIVGQEHITTTLKNALKKGAISHAYLFTGPRGVGKTSIARILAHEINGFDYRQEDMNLDIIEIDAASNRGIDEIRELREKAAVAPSTGKYKVYIIDEVHMLTTPAFNALLKTLEEPPAHVVFILATTEVHKLPETIISRTQRHTFRPVEQTKVITHLKHIAAAEKIKVDDEALAMIAAHGEGSFRDSISLLDQAASHGEAISAETIRAVLGVPPQEALQVLLATLPAGDRANLVSQLTSLYGQGYQAGAIAKQLAAIVRGQLLDNQALLEPSVALTLLEQLIGVPASPAPERLLEITLLRAMLERQTASTSVSVPTAVQSIPANKPKPRAAKPPTSAVTPAHSRPIDTTTLPKPSATVADQPPVNARQSGSLPQSAINDPAASLPIDELWPQLLQTIKQQYNTVYGILRLGVPELQGDQLLITFQYGFHQKRMQEAKHRKLISDALKQLTGQSVSVECRHDAAVSPPKVIATAESEIATPLIAGPTIATDSSLATISNIFGGGELLES